MSNQTVDVLKALYRAAWELHRCNPPRDNGRSLQAIWINDLSALVDQFVREQQAIPDREKELLAWIQRLENTLDTSDNYKLYLDNQEVIKNQVAEIERLNNIFESIKQASHDTNGYANKVISERDQLQDKCVLLQQQLDSLKQKVSEHNRKVEFGCNTCAGECGVSDYSWNCRKKRYMIDLGEHHEH